MQNAIIECLDPGAETSDAETCNKSQLVVPPDAPIVLRRNLVLDLMEKGRTPLTQGEFTAADFDAARAAPVILAPQVSSQWKAPQFVWQVRKELTTKLCGPDAETCDQIEAGGLSVTTTLDMRLQDIAEKWVKAATVVPNSKNPRATAKALGLPYQRWMDSLRSHDLHNGALVAMDYETGDVVAYIGSADPNGQKATKKFQPRFDVLADGWRQPGSAFKPVVYSTGIANKSITAASMFMDVVTNFGGGYTPTDADNLERGPVRMRDALSFSLNIPAVKAGTVIGNDAIQAQAEAMGIQFQNARVDAGAAFPLGVEVVHPLDLVRAYGTIGDRRPAGGADHDPHGQRQHRRPSSIEESQRPKPVPTRSTPGAAYITTDILAGNTNPRKNPFWGQFAINDGGVRRPATLKTGTSNEARDLNAYGFIAAPDDSGRKDGEYALVVGAWNGNSDNSLVSGRGGPLFSIDVTTYVWQGFMEESTKGWKINGFKAPNNLEHASVDPWTGLASSSRNAVVELFLPGTAPNGILPPEARCGEAVLTNAGFEDEHASWMAANQGWLARARRGPGRVGGPENTRDRVLLQPAVQPVRAVLGTAPRRRGLQAGREPVPVDRPVRLAIVGLVDPSAEPSVCPSPSESTAPSDTDGGPDGAADRGAHRAPDARADPGADARAHAGGAIGGARRARRVLAGEASGRSRRALSAPSQDIRPMIRPAAIGSRDRPREPRRPVTVHNAEMHVSDHVPGRSRRSRTAARAAALLGLLAIVALPLAPLATAAGGLNVTTPFPAVVAEPGSTATFDLTVNVPNAMRVDLKTAGVPEGWTARFRGGGLTVDGVYVDPKNPPNLTLDVEIPDGATASSNTITITATGGGLTSALPLSIRSPTRPRATSRCPRTRPASAGPPTPRSRST